MRRTKGVGKLSREDTLAMGLVGPIARAVGIPYDVRKTFPYLKYETFDFNVPDARPKATSSRATRSSSRRCGRA